MTTNAPEILETEIQIAARPETVFGFLDNADGLNRWLSTSADVDARPGGIFRAVMDGKYTASGTFVSIEPYSRVVFTWGWEGSDTLPPGASTVEITLIPDDGGTLLRLRHLDLPIGELESHRQGWIHFLAQLVTVAQ